MNRKKDVILRATVALTENYKKEELFMPKNNRELPSRAAVIDVVKELRSVIFRVTSGMIRQQRYFRNILRDIV